MKNKKGEQLVIKPGERQVRTDGKNMLVCTVIDEPNGQPSIITRLGKKEDTMSVPTLLTKIYGRPVVIMLE